MVHQLQQLQERNAQKCWLGNEVQDEHLIGFVNQTTTVNISTMHEIFNYYATAYARYQEFGLFF
jgi:hypothetical protein